MTDGRDKDDVVLWIVIAFCILCPVILLTLSGFGFFYPPMLSAVLLGIAVAALTYRYLGGTNGSQFSVGVLKVTSSAALLLGTTWFTNQGFSEQMDIENSAVRLVQAKKDHEALAGEHAIIKGQLAEARQRIEMLSAKSVDESLAQVGQLDPASPLGSKLVEMARKRLGPFSEVQRTLRINATSGPLKDENGFNACAALRLNGEGVRISSLNGDDARVVNLRQAGLIESVLCQKDDRKFDVQVACKAGQVLFPLHIAGCTDSGEVKWVTPGGQRSFPVHVEVLSEL